MSYVYWRSKARHVAYAYLGLFTTSLLLSIVIKTKLNEASFTHQVFNSHDLTGKDETVLMGVALLVFAVSIVLLVVGFWAGGMLFFATDQDRNLEAAYTYAQYWQIVQMIYMLLGCVEIVLFAEGLALVAYILLGVIWCCFMYIVVKFMGEIKRAKQIEQEEAII